MIPQEQRIGDWIQTRSGVKLYLLDARPEDFRIEDIAHALANLCRFTGHVSTFYSVAEHSVRVARSLRDFTPLTQYTGLMHDASEAYLNDMARPFKRLPQFQAYREAEASLMAQLAARFRFLDPLPVPVKEADNLLLATEARDLMAPVIDDWHRRHPMHARRIRPWTPRKAKREFLNLFYTLNPLGMRRPRRRIFTFPWSWSV